MSLSNQRKQIEQLNRNDHYGAAVEIQQLFWRARVADSLRYDIIISVHLRKRR